MNSIGKLQKDIHDSNAVAGWWTDLETGINLANEARKGTRLGKAIVA